MLHELELDGGEQGLQAVADAAFRWGGSASSACGHIAMVLFNACREGSCMPLGLGCAEMAVSSQLIYCHGTCLTAVAAYKLCVVFAVCSKADAPGRGIVNFGQVLVWYSIYMLGSSLAHGSVQQQ